MADFRFGPKTAWDREQVVYRTYICQISRFLDAHGIPNVLWGELVLNMLLIPLVIDVSPQFPRSRTNAAGEANYQTKSGHLHCHP
jgi:hypothetical protein